MIANAQTPFRLLLLFVLTWRVYGTRKGSHTSHLGLEPYVLKQKQILYIFSRSIVLFYLVYIQPSYLKMYNIDKVTCTIK